MTWRTGRADASDRLRETALVLTKLAKRKFLLQLFFLKEKLRNGSLHTIWKPSAMNRPPTRVKKPDGWEYRVGLNPLPVP
jgi:hypothetical protein